MSKRHITNMERLARIEAAVRRAQTKADRCLRCERLARALNEAYNEITRLQLMTWKDRQMQRKLHEDRA